MLTHINPKIRLDKNENPFQLPQSLKEEIFSVLTDVELNRYPDPGYSDIKKQLSYFTGFPTKSYILGNGGDEVLWLLFAAYVKPGAKVLTFSPSFSEYAHLCRVYGAEHITVPITFTEKDCFFNTELFLDTLRREKPVLVLIDTPNNPTGQTLPCLFLQEVIEQNIGITVIDEAYGEFANETFLKSLQANNIPARTVILKTLSKAWGLAGIRFGYGICNSDVAHTLNTIKSPFNINQLTAAIVNIVLKYPGLIQERKKSIQDNRESFIRQCNMLPSIHAYSSDANFVLVHIHEEKKIIQSLFEENDIAIKFFKIPDMGGSWIRVSIGLSGEMDKVYSCLSQLSKRFE